MGETLGTLGPVVDTPAGAVTDYAGTLGAVDTPGAVTLGTLGPVDTPGAVTLGTLGTVDIVPRVGLGFRVY